MNWKYENNNIVDDNGSVVAENVREDKADELINIHNFIDRNDNLESDIRKTEYEIVKLLSYLTNVYKVDVKSIDLEQTTYRLSEGGILRTTYNVSVKVNNKYGNLKNDLKL